MQDKKQQVNYLLPSNFPSIESILEPLTPWFEFEGFFGTTNKTVPSFELIYQRELKETKSEDTEAFRSWLIAKVSEMKDYEQSLPAKDRKRSLDVQHLADEFLKWIETRKSVKRKEEPLFLQDIFIEKKNFKSAIQALKIVKVIDKNNNNLIGSKLKGVMQVWIDILRSDRKYIKQIHDKDLTVLLNDYFSGLNLSEKTDGKHFRNTINRTASNQYGKRLLASIR